MKKLVFGLAFALTCQLMPELFDPCKQYNTPEACNAAIKDTKPKPCKVWYAACIVDCTKVKSENDCKNAKICSWTKKVSKKNDTNTNDYTCLGFPTRY